MLVCRGSHFHFRAFWRPPAFSCHGTLRLGAPLKTHHYNRMLQTMVGRTRIIYECMLFLSEWNVGPTYCTRAAHTFTITVYHCVPSNHGRLRYVSNAFHSFSGVAVWLQHTASGPTLCACQMESVVTPEELLHRLADGRQLATAQRNRMPPHIFARKFGMLSGRLTGQTTS